MKRNLHLKYSSLLIVILLIIAMVLTACGDAQAQKTYTIGVVIGYPSAETVLESFKTKMAELGYVEGENITYIYNGVLEPDALDAEIEGLLAQKVDLILTLFQQAHLVAHQAVEGTDIPVLFDTAFDPVGEGLVESLSHPGGNATGIQFINPYPKAVEWLLKVAPETTQVYVPYISTDATAAQYAKIIGEAATTLGVETKVEEVQSVDEVVAAIEALPEDAAIFPAPSPALPLEDLIGVATEHGTAVGTIAKSFVEMGALVAYGVDAVAMGEQGARMADQLFQGTAPADLPVEAVEHYSSINLRTAEAIGLDIPDDILRQADTIVR